MMQEKKLSLTSAIASNARNLDEILYANRREINKPDSNGNFPLLVAVRKVNCVLVSTLVEEYQADVNIVDRKGNTPLIMAILACAKSSEAQMIVELLVNNEADVNAYGSNDNTPLICACFIDNVDCVRLLLDRKADCNAANGNGETPLIIAAARGNPKIVKELLDAGALADATDGQGNTALSVTQNRAVRELLIASGNDNDEDFDVEKIGLESLSIARGRTHDDVDDDTREYKSTHSNARPRGRPRQPLSRNRPIRRFPRDDRQAPRGRIFPRRDDSESDMRPRQPTQYELDDHLLRAAQHGRVDAIKPLIFQGANVNAKHPNTVLMEAAMQGHEAVVRELLACGAKINERDENRDEKGGNTALIYAVIHERTGVVAVLLENGADIFLANNQGYSAIMLAAHMNVPSLVILFKNKMGTNYIRALAQNVKTRDFWLAVSNGNSDIVEAYIGTGGDVDIKDDRGDPALCIAAKKGHEMVVKLLLLAKASVNAKDGGGDTALHRSVSAGNANIVAMLIAAKADPNIQEKHGWTAFEIADQGSEIWKILKKKTKRTYQPSSVSQSYPAPFSCQLTPLGPPPFPGSYAAVMQPSPMGYSPAYQSPSSASPSSSPASSGGISVTGAAHAILQNLGTFVSLASDIGNLGSDVAHHHMNHVPGDMANIYHDGSHLKF